MTSSGFLTGVKIYKLLQTIRVGDSITLDTEIGNYHLEMEVKHFNWLDDANGNHAKACRKERPQINFDSIVVYYSFSKPRCDGCNNNSCTEENKFEEAFYGEWAFDFSKQNNPVAETVINVDPLTIPVKNMFQRIQECFLTVHLKFTITRGEPVYTKSAYKI